MDNSAPIEFTLFAVNGAGKGNVSKPFRFKKESGLSISAICCAIVAAYFASLEFLYCIIIHVPTNWHEI